MPASWRGLFPSPGPVSWREAFRSRATSILDRLWPGAALCAAIAAALLLWKILTEPATILTEREAKLGINASELDFHSTLYFPKGVALRYPGYVVGIQKAFRGLINAPSAPGSETDYLHGEVAYFDREDLDRAWDYRSTNGLRNNLTQHPTAMFIAHVTAHLPTVRGEYANANECFLYNVLRSPALGKAGEPDRTSGLAWRDCNEADEWRHTEEFLHWGGRPMRDNQLYFNGLEALKAMGRAIKPDIAAGRYTHVLLIVMGWNTAQQEAVRNFNDLTGNLMAAAAETVLSETQNIPSFRPLVIGVTWPSYWSTGPLNLLSYPFKADDADEIGLSWVNLLMNDVLPEAIDDRIPLVVIGHSFGARAVTRAAFSSPALKCSRCLGPGEVTSSAALVVALQGAFSINRFIESAEAGVEGAPYRDALKLSNTQFLLTASEHDKAVGGMFVRWYNPAGSIRAYNKACSGERPWQEKSHFHCMKARETFTPHDPSVSGYLKSELQLCSGDGTGCSEAMPYLAGKRILYVDVSENVTAFNSPGSGGNAHSDIYRLSTGRLIWRALEAAAPARYNPPKQ